MGEGQEGDEESGYHSGSEDSSPNQRLPTTVTSAKAKSGRRDLFGPKYDTALRLEFVTGVGDTLVETSYPSWPQKSGELSEDYWLYRLFYQRFESPDPFFDHVVAPFPEIIRANINAHSQTEIES